MSFYKEEYQELCDWVSDALIKRSYKFSVDQPGWTRTLSKIDHHISILNNRHDPPLVWFHKHPLYTSDCLKLGSMVEYYLTGDVDLSKYYLAKDYTKRPYKAIIKGLYLYGQYYIDFIDLHLPKLLDIDFSKYSKWYNNNDNWDNVSSLLRN